MAQQKKSQTLYVLLAVMALFLVVGGFALFWITYRGVKFLEGEAAHAGTVMLGDAASLVGHADYVGTWKGGGITLTIDASGRATWDEKQPNESEKLNGSVSFDGDYLIVDALVVKKRKHIDRAPHVAGATTVLTLEGTELEKQ
jgi:hypothetical protein